MEVRISRVLFENMEYGDFMQETILIRDEGKILFSNSYMIEGQLYEQKKMELSFWKKEGNEENFPDGHKIEEYTLHFGE